MVITYATGNENIQISPKPARKVTGTQANAEDIGAVAQDGNGGAARSISQNAQCRGPRRPAPPLSKNYPQVF